MGKSNTRQFKMDPQLLFDVIQRQAGTLTKAILEGVMNGADAGASKIKITLTENQLTISDDGKGFRSCKEVEDFFETFGKPHTEAENKIYGNFRMGRGQLFSFGVNNWRTGKFSMNVDFKHDGLDYTLKKEQHSKKGCKIVIDLYDELYPYRLNSTVNDLKKWVKYSLIPVYLNDKLISVNPSDEKWDDETDDLYFRQTESGTLTVYNLGMYVCDFAESKFGVSGIAVSRKQLKVNFARNDIHDCPVWEATTAVIKTHVKEKRKSKSRRWSDGSREHEVKEFLAGETDFDDFQKFPVFKDITGSNWRLDRMITKIRSMYGNTISSGVSGNIKGDKAMQTRLAFILSDTTLERFEVNSTAEMINKIVEIADMSGYLLDHILELQHVSFENVTSAIKADYDYIDPKKYTVTQNIILKVIDHIHHELIWKMRDRCPHQIKMRNIVVGKSDTAHAWTDGATFIALNKNVIDTLDFGYPQWHKVMHLLVHEYCHNQDTSGSHIHDKEFYEQHHNANEVIGDLTYKAVRKMPKELELAERQARRMVVRSADTDRKRQNAIDKIQQLVACV